jgi:tetratricopeptide (TPR) repeat protein/peroxiredoxin
MLFLPAPLRGLALTRATSNSRIHPPLDYHGSSLPFGETRLAPQYPAKSPLEDVLRLVTPGLDEFVTEKHAFEITIVLNRWAKALTSAAPALSILAPSLDPAIQASSLAHPQENSVRPGPAIEIVRRQFAAGLIAGRDRFLNEIKNYFVDCSHLDTAEFEIISIEDTAATPLTVDTVIRYSLVGSLASGGRQERVGLWHTQWSRDVSGAWRAIKWEATEETLSRARDPIFVDVTSHAFADANSYGSQLAHGVDHWRTVLDGACGIDVYGNNGLAIGDFDSDGFDDLYVCQPAGLPNRLYRNRGDGTFEDVTEQSGVGILDSTACALFADFDNKGVQDLLVVCGSGPLLFLNDGKGHFSLQPDAFKFARPPQGTFTGAAVADYDRDGRLDIYFCVYSYYLGLDQYHYPAPYFDARNGPPNFLFHNQGNAIFEDRTESAGLNADNNRYSFACAWGNANGDDAPDLYVANDFGRANFYRNRGDGTFTVASTASGVEDPGAGMSAAWFDSNNQAHQDIYVANMWAAAGLRVSEQKIFHQNDSPGVRGFYQRHARGNSLYRNQGNGTFQNVGAASGVEVGRWAWSSDAWDFDHDGYPDLYIANGYISGPDSGRRDTGDLSSFFWRQVVAKSPSDATPSAGYERGWNAINELIRSDSTWNGYERNILYVNNRDGSFSEASGVAGLDLPQDARSFVLADLDRDGRLEVIVKNRNAPQLFVMHNVIKDLAPSIAFHLTGTKSNRDAIGASVTLETGSLRQTKYLQAGSGFLSQHTKDLFFGIGTRQSQLHVTVRWPSGLTQTFHDLPQNHRIEIVEGMQDIAARPFAGSPMPHSRVAEPLKTEPLPSLVETWLIEPLHAPDFSLPDLSGASIALHSFLGHPLLLTFWSAATDHTRDQLRLLQKSQPSLVATGLRVVAVNVDAPVDIPAARSFAAKENLSFPVLFATPEVAGVYNLVYRYLFDRRRDLAIPSSFLIDRQAMIVKLYQGLAPSNRIVDDLNSMPATPTERIRKALPFPGTLVQDEFKRNDFTYGVAFFQHGYLDQAAAAFQNVIATKPNEPEAYYNLGTLYLRKSSFPDAQNYLQQAVKLRPDYPEAWNNLGMIAAQQGQAAEGIRNFQESLRLRPDYAIALLNLGNLYRRQGNTGPAEQLLSRALELEPENPEASYSIGMLYARENQLDQALESLQRAIALRPDYPDALNNLGVLLVRQQKYPEAQDQFETCIRVAPDFDQAYLNLARLYVVLNDKAKAKEVLQALLRRQPQHKMAQQALEMLN